MVYELSAQSEALYGHCIAEMSSLRGALGPLWTLSYYCMEISELKTSYRF